MKRILCVLAVVGWSATAFAQQPPVRIFGQTSTGVSVPVRVDADGVVATNASIGDVTVGAETCTDADDGTIAAAQTCGLNISMQYVFDGTNMKRMTFGTAGSAATQVWTVQGIASMTPLLFTGTGTAGTPATGVVSVQGITSMTPLLATVSATNLDVQIGGSDTVQVQSNSANLATQTTLAAMAADIATGVAGNSGVSMLSDNTNNDDETEIKATPGVLAGIRAFNSDSTATYIRCVNKTAANTTPGSETLIYDGYIPATGGFVDNAIERTFSVALTCYFATGDAVSDTTDPAQNKVRAMVTYR